jgi:aryl-alcohol dehydrogenase-like predicted oxidoreductase
MNYRYLGRTGLRISEIGFGCGNIGGLMVRGTFDEQVSAVARAVELGINYFDTAPDYGRGQSETNLGKVLAHLKPDVHVGTKVRVNPENLPDLAGFIASSVETSLTRLGRDYVDLLQLHTPIVHRGGQGLTVDNVIGFEGVADVFESLRQRGLTRFIGITGLGDTAAVKDVINSGRFDTVQAYYNLLNPSAGQEVPAGFGGQDFDRLIIRAGERGMGVIAIRVMAGGALGGAAARTGYASPTVGGALAAGSDYEKDERRVARILSLAGDELPLQRATVRFALMNESVSTAMVGFSDSAQIDEAVTAAGEGPLPDAFMTSLRTAWEQDAGV